MEYLKNNNNLLWCIYHLYNYLIINNNNYLFTILYNYIVIVNTHYIIIICRICSNNLFGMYEVSIYEMYICVYNIVYMCVWLIAFNKCMFICLCYNYTNIHLPENLFMTYIVVIVIP